jgi:hypothetical protein
MMTHNSRRLKRFCQTRKACQAGVGNARKPPIAMTIKKRFIIMPSSFGRGVSTRASL